MHRALLALVGTIIITGCARSPSSPDGTPAGPPVELSFGIGPYYAAAGSTLGLLIDANTSLSRVRCHSSNGDTVDVSFGFVDYNVYMWQARLHAKTVGQTTVSCTADPNASGSTTVNIRETVDSVKMRYVRRGIGGAQVDPTVGGSLEVNSNFRLTDGATQWPTLCSGTLLAWDPETHTLTCRVNVFRSVAVNFLNAACVTDPAYVQPGFEGGAIYVNDTLLTTPWTGSTPKYQCMLFTIDGQGTVSPPK